MVKVDGMVRLQQKKLSMPLVMVQAPKIRVLNSLIMQEK